ncbi:type II toxin-antitoxin system HicB family antitoxin [Mesorhizobium sp. J428]|uniref:type II toxin-antitoxin system HicB family antitoxin n=1 Tax=Mesorhizobium sp. J428 TaxID=2898440 RepID=UPI0021512800|nr:type II toxin-antitoxin system HicB family antitoxin [Mesorhizobium sp. J428]MCR5858206.1 type II toxin-antitoxin system HicB family antitoxin [Mesorhizobium sp. J428]
MAQGLKMTSHYIALIHKEPGSGYGVSFPDLIGVTTVADTLDDALREASVALAFALEDWQGAAPRPRSLDVLRTDPAFLDWSTDAVVAAVSPTGSMNEAA